jgi:ubiquinone/menaquinone biosynthesis C-methylase UbiE
MSELTWDTLYTDHAGAYEVLVSHEDYLGNLPHAIQAIQPLAGQVGVEFGCGTGRVSGLLAGSVRRLHAFDFTASILQLAQQKLYLRNWKNVSLALADSRRMPVRSGWADFAIEGWAFLQIAVWNPHDWQNQLGRASAEMGRLVRPGGKLILIETLGTGESTPKVTPFFRTVYDYLESQAGFIPLDAIRTDYRFETLEQIRQVVLPLFGQEMLARLVETQAGWVLPECTGLWWRNRA